MASGQDCCAPCPTVQTVNIPGSPGAAGPAGAPGDDGINAFTFVAEPGFLVPACGANVTVPTVNSLWESIGQKVFVEGAGVFEVVSKNAGGSSTVLKYLCGYTDNTHSGDSIPAGAQVSPSGTQLSLLPEQAFYAVGGSQALTASNAQLLSAVVTLPTDGDFFISASVRLDYSSATTLSSKTIFLKLRETTNGPADIANAVRELATGIVTGADWTLGVPPLPSVVYTATAGDTIQLQGSISALLDDPYEAGDVIVVEATILALPIA